MFNLLVSTFNALPPFRGKQRILNTVFRWLPFSNARSFYGVFMVNNVKDSTWRACMVGSYGTFISEYITSLNRKYTFLDIGANQGLFGLCAASNPKCQKIIAFEPNPSTYSLLVSNIELADDCNKFHPVCAAIGDESISVIEMVVPDGHSGASSSQLAGSAAGKHFSAIVVGGEMLKQILGNNDELEMHAKIDVEGAELVVLQELARTGVLNCITSIIIEMSANIEGTGHINEIIKFFENENWQMHKRSDGTLHYDAIYLNRNLQNSTSIMTETSRKLSAQ